MYKYYHFFQQPAVCTTTSFMDRIKNGMNIAIFTVNVLTLKLDNISALLSKYINSEQT